jgi:hypothetical protein
MKLDLAKQSTQVVLCPILTIDLEIKSAEVTAATAEWDVDVKTEVPGGRG